MLKLTKFYVLKFLLFELGNLTEFYIKKVISVGIFCATWLIKFCDLR